MELTEKQERFCQAYIEFGEKGRAYRDAFDAEAMNSNSVAVEANKLFKDPKITLRVKELQDEIRERNKVKIDDVLGVLADMIKFDIAEIYDENGYQNESVPPVLAAVNVCATVLSLVGEPTTPSSAE